MRVFFVYNHIQKRFALAVYNNQANPTTYTVTNCSTQQVFSLTHTINDHGHEAHNNKALWKARATQHREELVTEDNFSVVLLDPHVKYKINPLLHQGQEFSFDLTLGAVPGW